MTYSSRTITLYDFLLTAGVVIGSPFVALRMWTNPRFRFRLRDRFIPGTVVDGGDYMLVHTSSFGETRAMLGVMDRFESALGMGSVFSVFSDSAYRFAVKKRPTILMPLDITMMYRRIFLTPPRIAVFFETEIWPSYIRFLKDAGVPLTLVNARLSERSLKFYSLLPPLKKAVGMFDIVLAKSDIDAERFSVLNSNCIPCGNIKKYRKYMPLSRRDKLVFSKQFGIPLDIPVVTLGSVHKEELGVALKVVRALHREVFVVLAPRHMEDINAFLRGFGELGIGFRLRSSSSGSGNVMLLDTLGELESVYGVSNVAVVFGSFARGIGGHNPLEPLSYGVYTICGKYMDSFEEEVRELVDKGLVEVVESADEVVEAVRKGIESGGKVYVGDYFCSLEGIVECYIANVKRLLEGVT